MNEKEGGDGDRESTFDPWISTVWGAITRS